MSGSIDTQASAIKYPELVFGLIGAVGTDSDKILDALDHALKQVRYNQVIIRLIDGLRQLEKWRNIDTEPLDLRYTSHMDAGNEFRKLLGRGDALALIGASSIAKERTKITEESSKPAARTAYVLRSLKRPEEVSTLREIYGRNFFTLAAYSPKIRRSERLASKIAESRRSGKSVGIQTTANQLIERDEAELQDKSAQRQLFFTISDN
jgi:cytidine deaminase